VQAGSIADTVTGSANRQLSRTFSGNWNLSYGRNNGLTVNGPTATLANQTFGYWSNNVGVNHLMGRTMNVSLNYSLQYQNSNSAFCVGPTCGSSIVRHQIMFSLGWHDHPIPF
jgi:outer membrane autotransporter protein